MFSMDSKEIKLFNETNFKSTKAKKESLLDNMDKERNSPDPIINFINKKIPFKSEFDENGSKKFLSSKDMALYDVKLDDKIEEDCENETYNNISFMKKFTFDVGNNLVIDEEDWCLKNPFCHLLNNKLYKSENIYDDNYYSDQVEKINEKN